MTHHIKLAHCPLRVIVIGTARKELDVSVQLAVRMRKSPIGRSIDDVHSDFCDCVEQAY